MNSKVIGIQEAAKLVNDGDTVITAMGGGKGNPGYLLKSLEDRFLTTGSPKNLTKVSGCGHSGDIYFAHRGMLAKFIGAHPGGKSPLARLIDEEAVEAYGLPQGVMQQLYRAIAARQPGILSKIGIGTYIDPRMECGRLNGVSKDSLSYIMNVEGEDWIFYKSFPVNVALLRATTADEFGNLTVEEESLKLELLEAALAARASNGKVIAQVKRIVAGGSLKAKDVFVAGEIVDAVVVAEEPEKYHIQGNKTYYSPFLSGELKAPRDAIEPPKEVLDMADLICRRAVYELYPGAIVNVGVGVGVGVGAVAAVENMSDRVTFTVEHGAIGGTPQPLIDFGSSKNPTAFFAHPSMFDFYHGGGLDIAFLGAAEVDREGNVNVSRFGKLKSGQGQGGFIDISTCAKKVVFCTYFMSGGFEAAVQNGRVKILSEGKNEKFVDSVNQITFNGGLAVERGQEVVFITERCVFTLTGEGITLTEIAPGIDVERDIVGKMGFKPTVSDKLRVMDGRIHVPGRMGCFGH